MNGDNDFADCELAWTNFNKTVRRLQWRWNGMIRQGNERKISSYTKAAGCYAVGDKSLSRAETVLDPWMGSGTTRLPVFNGRKFIGIERDQSILILHANAYSKRQPKGLFFYDSQKTKQDNCFRFNRGKNTNMRQALGESAI